MNISFLILFISENVFEEDNDSIFFFFWNVN